MELFSQAKIDWATDAVSFVPEGTPAAPSIFFGQHDRNDAPRDGRVSRIGRVVHKIFVVVVDLE